MTKKKKFMTGFIVLAIVMALSGLLVYQKVMTSKKMVKEIFKLNSIKKIEGYYLSEFEFKMLGAVYYLDHGHFIRADACLKKIHKQLSTNEGLIKIPEFLDIRKKLEFYKNRQNPKTGAFMDDDSLPLFTYIGVTANMISYIEDLSIEANKKFQLKYPLKWLDEISSSEKLITLLNDISTVSWLGSKMPKTPFVEIGELMELSKETERLGLYTFSDEWKHSFYQWCYENQDKETGLWGPRLRKNNKLIKGGDIVDSEKIIKIFIGHDGKEIHPEFPLKYRNQMFASGLKKLTNPMPEDLDELHDWILSRDRGIRYLTRYLWEKPSIKDKEATRKLICQFIRTRFEHYYIESEGAFSLYPNTEHADLDGTGEAIGTFRNIGASSNEKQKKLWGDPKKNMVDLGEHTVLELKESDLKSITGISEVNSIRFYRKEPDDDYKKNVVSVFYPKETKVLDIVDLHLKILKWLKATPQNMGNWIKKEDLLRSSFAKLNLNPVSVSNTIPLGTANKILSENSKLVVIGYDILQVPHYKIVFKTMEKK